MSEIAIATSALQTLKLTIGPSVKDLTRAGIPSTDPLYASYSALEKEIDATLGRASTFQAAEMVAKLNEHSAKLTQLNTQRDTVIKAEEERRKRPQTLQEFGMSTLDWVSKSFRYMITVFCFLLGGIVLSHTFIDEKWYYRFYYFVYGAAFFPFTVLYGMAKPPTWRAPLAPLIMRGEGEPVWTQAWWAASITGLVKYDPPDIESGDSDKKTLRMMCLVGVLGFVASYFISG